MLLLLEAAPATLPYSVIVALTIISTVATALGVRQWLPSLFSSYFNSACKKEVQKLRLQLMQLASALEMYIANEADDGKKGGKADLMLIEILEQIKKDNAADNKT